MSATPAFNTPAFGTPMLGQTEKALNAILIRELAGTGLTEPLWISLTVTRTLTVAGSGAVDRDVLVGQVAFALKISEDQAQSLIGDLAAAQLVQVVDGEAPVRLTDAGQQLHARIRSVVAEITDRMWGDLPADDLDAAGRVLSIVLARANAELASA